MQRITKTIWILSLFFLALPLASAFSTSDFPGARNVWLMDGNNNDLMGSTDWDTIQGTVGYNISSVNATYINTTSGDGTWRLGKTTGYSISSTADFSVSFWVYVGSASATERFFWLEDSGNQDEFYLQQTGTSWAATFRGCTGLSGSISTGWQQWTWTFDNANNNVSMYIDGAYQGSDSCSSFDSNIDGFIVGRGAASSGLGSGYYVDHVVTKDAKFNESEVKNLYYYGTLTNSSSTPVSEPFAHVKVIDKYDSTAIEGVTVTLADGTSNTSDSSGIAYFYNKTGQNFNFTDTQGRYFSRTGLTAVENTTTTVNATGAFITFTAKDLLNNTVNEFNVSSGNQFNQTSSGSLKLILPPNSTTEVYVNATDYYENIAFNVTTGLQDTSSYELSNLYQAKLNVTAVNSTGSSLSNFSVRFTGAYNTTLSTTGSLLTANLMEGDYELRADVPTYAYSYENLTNLTGWDSLEFLVYQTNSLNVSFYDEQTGALINNVNLDYYSNSGTSGTQNTTSGNMLLSLVIPDDYIFIYDADGYDERHYEFTVADRSFAFLNLTLLNATESTTVTITVKDTLNNIMTDAVVKIYKFNVAENDDELIEVRRTNFEGVTIASLLLNSDLYRFVVEVDGETALTTSRTQVYGNTLTLIVNTLTNTGFESVFNNYRMEGLVSFTPNTFTFTYNDQSNTLQEACLDVYQVSTKRTLVNSSCSSASSNTLTAGVQNVSGRTYQAFGYITGSDGTRYDLSTAWGSYDEQFSDDGSSLLMMILIIVMFALLLSVSVEIAIIGAFLVPVIFTATNLTLLPYTVTVPLAATGVVLAFIMGVIRK